MSDPVAEQYEAYPYPPRDPKAEAKSLVTGSPSHILEIEHYVFAGRLPAGRPFRALIAGGGTGDAAIMLAQQLADRGHPAEVVYLDQSQASRRIAEARAAARRLDNLRFVTGSLLALPALGLESFDYIDCCGVLHHLPDPLEGLKGLVAALAPGGGLGLMLYGEIGRTGVYHVQDMLRRIDGGLDAAGRVALTRRILGHLPPTNWLVRNREIIDHKVAGDAALFDLLLHSRDRAYRVPEIHGLVEAAGLRLVTFIEPCRYDPASYLSDVVVRERLAKLDPVARAAFAEELAGNLKTHVFYALRADDPKTPPATDDPAVIPTLRVVEGQALARTLQKELRVRVDFQGVPLMFMLPRFAPPIVAEIDGHRTLGEIHAAVAQKTGLDWPRFAAEFARIQQILTGLNLMLLRLP